MRYFLLLVFLDYHSIVYSQSSLEPTATNILAGYNNLVVTDSSRIYKQQTSVGNRLHFRPIEIDCWYPASTPAPASPLEYGYFINLLQQRSNRFQDDTIYDKMTSGLVEFLSANLNITDTSKLTHLPTVSYANANPITKQLPLIVYFCSYNGMSYENVSLFESLAVKGYRVACITSVGRYPGNMSSQLPDLMEQIKHAEFAIHFLEAEDWVDTTRIGVIGYSWGGLAALILAMNNTQVKCLLSFDGSELHYYGDSKDEDLDFDQIINSVCPGSKKLEIPYAYLESGFKQSDQIADSIFPVATLLKGQEIYLRFPKATHEDFSCLTSLSPKANSHEIPYKEFALHFFDTYLKGSKKELSPFLDSLVRSKTADSTHSVAKNKRNLIIIKGRISDEKNREPLAFVNVGIRDKNTGTVSAQDGHFQLKIDPSLKDDLLTFSMAGYQTREIRMTDLLATQKPVFVTLREKTALLKEVTITSKTVKTAIKGNTTTSNFVNIGLPLKFLGSETGVRLHLGKKTVLLKTFSFNISENGLDTAVFRMNIYSMKNGYPFENILHQNILIPIGKQTGKYTVNLKDYKLILSGDVLLSLEWIEGSASGHGNGVIFLSAGFLNSYTWHRLTSQAEWKKAPGLGVGFNVLVQKL